MNEDDEDGLRYVLGMVIATQEYMAATDPNAGEDIAAYLRAIAKIEREEGNDDLALKFETRAEILEEANQGYDS